MKISRICSLALLGAVLSIPALAGNGISASAEADRAKAGEFDTALPDVKAAGTDVPLPERSAAAGGAAKEEGADFHIERSHINTGGDALTFVHLTDIHIGEGGDGPRQRLGEAVAWINAHKDQENIALVMITGDVSSSGEMYEFRQAKAELDALTVPYVPLFGNHDVWPYDDGGDLTNVPVGDQYFLEVFGPVFEKLKKTEGFDWDDGTRTVKTLNTEMEVDGVENVYSYFQNFSFTYGNHHFLCADFNTRHHALPIEQLGKNGALPGGDLFDFEGGTWRWFNEAYNKYKAKDDIEDNILIFAHHPLTANVISGVPLPLNIPDDPEYADIFGDASSPDRLASIYGFNKSERMQLEDLLINDGNQRRTGAWIAGHIHRNRTYDVTTTVSLGPVVLGSRTICPGIETAALKDGNLRIITVGNASAE